jgi:hypothetical protein
MTNPIIEYAQFLTVYVYKPDTGEFDHVAQAQLSPLDAPGTYLKPMYCTETAPPSNLGPNQVAVFDQTKLVWTIQPDYRGVTIYKQTDGSVTEVTAIGPVPSGYATTPPPPTPAQQIAALEFAVQQYIDLKAQAKGYDSAASCISYLNSGNAIWQSDAKAMNVWRDAVWTFCFNNEASVQSGTTPTPTAAQLIAALPAAPW